MTLYNLFLKALIVMGGVGTALAAPMHCQPVSLAGEAIHLLDKNPHFVLFHNISTHQVFVTHSVPTAQGDSWSRLIEPNRWSLLLLTESALAISCVESTPGHEQQMACQQALVMCEWTAPAMEKPQTQWVAENTAEPPMPTA